MHDPQLTLRTAPILCSCPYIPDIKTDLSMHNFNWKLKRTRQKKHNSKCKLASSKAIPDAMCRGSQEPEEKDLKGVVITAQGIL